MIVDRDEGTYGTQNITRATIAANSCHAAGYNASCSSSVTTTIDDSHEMTSPPQRAFKDMYHELIRTIWNVDRFNPNKEEKLRELRAVLTKYNPSIVCDILHETTGQVIAQASPLLIASFEGDSDVIALLIESGADPNQTESEHNLSPLHIICDAEYNGQSLKVNSAGSAFIR